jgi:hypothetical protein
MEKEARVNLFSWVVLGVLVVLSIYFVFAISTAPTGLTFGRNVTPAYDEGNFSVNWTSGGGQAEANYSIYIFANNILFNKSWNNSLTGYSFGNYTEANYTFIIGAVNATANETNSTTNISMYVDRTAPLINLTTSTAPYTNGTFKQNTNTLTLNISLTDATSGLTGSACFIDINGTNQTVFASSGWCNTTTGNLTGLADGNKTIKVYANDTVGNLALNNSFVVRVDTTAPLTNLTTYSNGTFKQNTSTLTLNISLTDGLSGFTGSACLININGTNQTVSVGTGNWCNTTTGNLTGLSDGNQIIRVYVNDTAGNLALNNSFVVQIDTTAATIALPSYTNATPKKNTETLTLNISLTDATSGLTGSACFIDINGTNQTVFASDGWCNTTTGNLTGLADGNKTIKVYVNDTIGNLGLNDSFVVQIDTTAPSASASCTPATVYSGNTVSCSCSGSDATSGVASTTASSTPSTANTGTFSYDCTVIDNAGNSASNSDSYVVELSSSGGSSGGGSASATSFWTGGTFSVTKEQFETGYSKEMLIKQRVMVSVAESNHYIGVREVSATTAKIEVTSTPQEKILSVGEEWKIEVTGDDFYDLNVKLTSVQNSKANVFVKSIHEAVPVEASTPEEAVGETEQPTITGEATEGDQEKSSLLWLWLLIAIAVVAFVVWIVFKNKNSRKR